MFSMFKKKTSHKMDDELTCREAFLLALDGKNPSSAIENQERRGQASVVANQILPKKMNSLSIPRYVLDDGVDKSMPFEEQFRIEAINNVAYTKQKYEELGITIVNEYDDLFLNVILPEGWKIESTDHPMWNYLFDDSGKKIASFFYKAAFYDRDAFINFEEEL